MANGSTRYFIPKLGAIWEKYIDLSWLLVRGMYGYFFIPHGMQKLFGLWGGSLAGTAAYFDKIYLTPGWFWAPYIGCLELFGGFLILIGLFTRPVALLFAGFMFVAETYANVPFGYFWTKSGIEMPILLFVLSLAILIRGGGPYSLDRKWGREF